MALTISFLVLEILILALGVFLGYRRSTGRSIVRLIYLAVLGVLALFLGRWAAGRVGHFIFATLRKGLNADILAILNSSPELEKLLIGLICTLLLPVFFAVLFGIFEALSTICLKKLSKKIVVGVTGKDEEPQKKYRIIGAAIGAVTAFMVFTVLFSPVSVLMNISEGMTDETVNVIGEMLASEERTDIAAENYAKGLLSVENPATDSDGAVRLVMSLLRDLKKTSENPLVKVGNPLGDVLTVGETPRDVSYHATDEVPKLVNAATVVLRSVNDFENLSGVAKINSIAKLVLPAVADSPVGREAVVALARAVGNIIREKGSFAGIDKNSGNVMSDIMVGAIADVLAEITVENLDESAMTLFGIDIRPQEPQPDGSKESEDTKAPDTGKAPGETQEPNGTDPSGTEKPSTPAKPDVKNERGALEYLEQMDFSNPEEILKDESSYDDLICAIYVVSKNPAMQPIVDAFGDIGGEVFGDSGTSPLPKLTEAELMGLYELLLVSMYEETYYPSERTLEEKTKPIKDTVLSMLEDNAYDVSESRVELGAICIVAHFYTEENMAMVGSSPEDAVSFEEFKAYLGM